MAPLIAWYMGRKTDKFQAMHQGVVRDMEQQRLKKERQLDFDMQKALEESYKKVQTVHDGGQAPPKLVEMTQVPEPPKAGDVGGPPLK